MSLKLKVTAFPNRGVIPKKHTCAGANSSPALEWAGVSLTTRSLALIVDDPDAPRGTWTHWLIWNIPPHLTALPEGIPAQEVLEFGAWQGTNDFNRIGYGGPCPPPGKAHRYFFKLYALNTVLDLKPGASKKDLERAVKGHIVSDAEYVGTYAR
ncbi:MAG TPA: YbhB/YbcL family Raf kinase inhibitor-like protein [Terracidiphilus sp.]|nr:YbhB/YbcL family Raf kinase inhibitor-like protein [Terracidiphilus sp.]